MWIPAFAGMTVGVGDGAEADVEAGMGRATTRVARPGLGGSGGGDVGRGNGWKYILGFMGDYLLAPACRLSSHLQSACRTPAEPPARHLQNTCIYLKTPARRKIFSGGRSFHIAGFIFPTPNSNIRGIYVLYAITIGQRVGRVKVFLKGRRDVARAMGTFARRLCVGRCPGVGWLARGFGAARPEAEG